MKIKRHLFPGSTCEAVEMLKSEKGKARLIAGGTDLIVAIRNKENTFDVLVDISGIPDIKKIEAEENTIHLGPGVSMTQAENSELIINNATVLAEGCSWVGGPQIRNRATITGNVISAQPAADAALALFALDAELTVEETSTTATVKIEDAYRGIGESAVDSAFEMVSCISFKKHEHNEVSVFKRMMRRNSLTLPILNCAVRVKVKNENFSDIRIALGPVAKTPVRIKEAEERLRGEAISQQNISAAAVIASKIAAPRSSYLRGSSAYRKDMSGVIVGEAIKTALVRLGVEGFDYAGN